MTDQYELVQHSLVLSSSTYRSSITSSIAHCRSYYACQYTRACALSNCFNKHPVMWVARARVGWVGAELWIIDHALLLGGEQYIWSTLWANHNLHTQEHWHNARNIPIISVSQNVWITKNQIKSKLLHISHQCFQWFLLHTIHTHTLQYTLCSTCMYTQYTIHVHVCTIIMWPGI